MPVYTDTTPDTPRNRGNYDAPHVSPVTPAEDIRTVMLNRVSWGAVFSGVALTLVCQLVLNLLGFGLGIVATENGTVTTAAGRTVTMPVFTTSALIWCAIAGIIAVCIGGYAAGRLSGEPRESTAGWHGLTAWAASVIVVIVLATMGASTMIGGPVSAAQLINPSATMSDNGSAANNGLTGNATGNAARTAEPNAAPSATGTSILNSDDTAVSDARSAAMRDAWISCVALVLSAIAAWFGGRSGAVDPTITDQALRRQPLH
jgi:hypothetical protein